VEHDAAGRGRGHPLGDIEAGLDRMDPLQPLGECLGQPHDGDQGKWGQQEHGWGEDRLEGVDGGHLTPVLELQGREGGCDEQDEQ
jgi:hypothetical protein